MAALGRQAAGCGRWLAPGSIRARLVTSQCGSSDTDLHGKSVKSSGRRTLDCWPSTRRQPLLSADCNSAPRPEMRSHAKPLAWDNGVAFIITDLSSTSKGTYKELWRTYKESWRTRFITKDRHLHLVGTRNGLLCICDKEGRRSADPSRWSTRPPGAGPRRRREVQRCRQRHQRQRCDILGKGGRRHEDRVIFLE